MIARIKKNLLLAPGWRTRRKLVVIESDDWGTSRIPDPGTYQALTAQNPLLADDLMNRYDSLETDNDLTALFEVLQTVKDRQGKPAVLTADTVMANPDFDRIAASGFNEYHYELFTDTLSRYPACAGVMELIRQGMERGVYHPQFHAREHVNVSQWLAALRQGNPDLTDAFRHRVFGITFRGENKKRRNIVSAYDFENASETAQHRLIVTDGLRLFEKVFGFRSESFIATTYVWHPLLEDALSEAGVRYIQGIPYQYIPHPGGSWYRKKFHYTGQRNRLGQVYLVRNVFFEPSIVPGQTDWVGECMRRIALAFKWGKPAIICAHRVNFMGGLVERNRTENLSLFKELLQRMVKRWPEVEFMTSDSLGQLITGNDS